MPSTPSAECRRRVDERIAAWRISVDHLVETDSSILAFGQRDDQSVVLKIIRNHGEEWRSGDALVAFDGHGVVCVLDHIDGAVLLERLKPGDSLARMALDGRDDQATAVIAGIIGRMSPRAPAGDVATVAEWGRGFDFHRTSAHRHIPHSLVESAKHVYVEMCASQSRPRLLHGDLHHYNVLLDSARGWLAIDPKGVVGEPEYEVGAALRNPYERPDVFTSPSAITRRVDRFARELNLGPERMLAWAFAQAVLAALWTVEDGPRSARRSRNVDVAERAGRRNPRKIVARDDRWIALARNILPMLKGIVDC